MSSTKLIQGTSAVSQRKSVVEQPSVFAYPSDEIKYQQGLVPVVQLAPAASERIREALQTQQWTEQGRRIQPTFTQMPFQLFQTEGQAEREAGAKYREPPRIVEAEVGKPLTRGEYQRAAGWPLLAVELSSANSPVKEMVYVEKEGEDAGKLWVESVATRKLEGPFELPEGLKLEDLEKAQTVDAKWSLLSYGFSVYRGAGAGGVDSSRGGGRPYGTGRRSGTGSFPS